MKTKMFITLLLLVAAFFAQCQTDATFRNLDVRDKSKLRGLIYPFGAVASNLNPNTDEVAMVRTTNFTLIRVDFWEFLDSIANHISGTPDTFYLAYGCYGNIDGWKHSGDTIFVDTCFSAGDSCYWYKDSDTLKPKHDYVRVPKLFADRMFYQGGTGDVNNSHTITGTDAQWIWQYLTGARTFTKWQKMEADLDGDGFITQSDADIVSGIVAMKYPNSLTLYDSLKRKIGLYNTGLDGNTDFHIRRLALLDSLPLGNKSKIMVSYYDAMKSADVIKYIPWDSITANIPNGSTDTFYVAHGCYNDPDGWKYSGDTIYIDTCFGGGSNYGYWQIGDAVATGTRTEQVASHELIKFEGAGTVATGYDSTTHVMTITGSGGGDYWTFVDAATDTLKNKVALAATPGVMAFKSDVITDRWLNTEGNTIFGRNAGHQFTHAAGAEGYYNTLIGGTAGNAITSGYQNTAIGMNAMSTTTTGHDNTAVGFWALKANLGGYNNTALGTSALIANTSGNDNTAFGYNTLYTNTEGLQNTALGGITLNLNQTGSYSTAVGYGALEKNTVGQSQAFGNGAARYNTTGLYNTAVGYNALLYNSTGTENLAVGYKALQGVSTKNQSYNTAVGAYSLYSDAEGGSWNTAFGYKSSYANTVGQMNTALGYQALYSNVGNSGSVAVGYTAMYKCDDRAVGRTTYNTAVGNGAMYGSATAANNTGQYNTAIGYQALAAMTSGASNIAIGYLPLGKNTTGNNNTSIGNASLYENLIGVGNTGIGNSTLRNNSGGNYNTAVGYEAMFYANSVVASTNTFNAALGYRALYGSTTAANNTGVQNSAVGVYALMNNTSGDYCVAVGTSASYTNSTGDDNTAIGHSALYLNQTGINNVALGYQAAYNETGSNKLYIESSNSTTPLIYGEFDNDIIRVYGTKVERTDKTIADNDATPDVSASNVWTYAGTANAVTITDLDNPDVGAIYYLIGNDDTYTMTIADGGNFNLSASWTGGHDDVLILYCIADNNYIEFGRVDN